MTYRLPLGPRLLGFGFLAVVAVAFIALGSTTVGGIMGASVVVGLPLSFRTRVSVDASGVRYAVTTGGTRSIGGYGVGQIDTIADELEQYRRHHS